MADIPPPPPPPPSDQPPPAPGGYASPPPGYSAPPPGYQPGQPPSPGYMPPGIGPTSGTGIDLGRQLAGASVSIIFGVISVLVPVVTSIVTGGSVFYFYILPVFGIFRGIQAMTRGFVIGGIIGIVLNLIGGLVSVIVATSR